MYPKPIVLNDWICLTPTMSNTLLVILLFCRSRLGFLQSIEIYFLIIIFGYIFSQSSGHPLFLVLGHDYGLRYIRNELFENIFLF